LCNKASEIAARDIKNAIILSAVKFSHRINS
jgi:hypothetical protein